MMRNRAFSLIVAAFLASGCATTIPPVEVTRFHTGSNMGAGEIAIVAPAGGDSQALEFRTYAAAVAQQLSRLGFREASASATPYIAEVEVTRGVREELSRRSPVTIGVGGGTFGRNVGISMGTAIGLGGNGPRQVAVTKLSVRLKNRTDGKAFWEGRAESSARVSSPAAQPGLAAQKLADALFRDFPGKSGETVIVP